MTATKNESDHNTIHLKVKIPQIDKTKPLKRTGWNVNASDEKWELFTKEIKARQKTAEDIMADKDKPLEIRYKMALKEIEKAGMRTIGKTTYKEGKMKKSSKELRGLQNKKKEIKKQIQKEKEKSKKDR